MEGVSIQLFDQTCSANVDFSLLCILTYFSLKLMFKIIHSLDYIISFQFHPSLLALEYWSYSATLVINLQTYSRNINQPDGNNGVEVSPA